MRIVCAAAIALLVALPAWGGTTEHAAGPPTKPFGVLVSPIDTRMTERGPILTDTAGFALYTLDVDEPGQSHCNETCESQWEPLRPESFSHAVGRLTMIRRADGSKQWAYLGRPLYRYRHNHDQSRDGTTSPINSGKYANAIAHVVGPDGTWSGEPPEVVVQVPAGILIRPGDPAPVYTDAAGHTLYERYADYLRKSTCDSVCTRTWHPLEAPASEWSPGVFETIRRVDGQYQRALFGLPLYTYAGDTAPGDEHGVLPHVARVASPEPETQPYVNSPDGPFGAHPRGIAVGMTEFGPLLTDHAGVPLYTLDVDQPGQSHCDGKCLTEWAPFQPSLFSDSVGRFTIVRRNDGVDQWAYLGKPLYRHRRAKDEPPDGTPRLGRSATHASAAAHLVGPAGTWPGALPKAVALVPPGVFLRPGNPAPVFTDSDGFTLYERYDDFANRSGCDAACERNWYGLQAAWRYRGIGNFSVVWVHDRLQWALRNWALYAYAGDKAPGDERGAQEGIARVASAGPEPGPEDSAIYTPKGGPDQQQDQCQYRTRQKMGIRGDGTIFDSIAPVGDIPDIAPALPFIATSLAGAYGSRYSTCRMQTSAATTEFIRENTDHIVVQAAQGGGEYLAASGRLLNCPPTALPRFAADAQRRFTVLRDGAEADPRKGLRRALRTVIAEDPWLAARCRPPEG